MCGDRNTDKNVRSVCVVTERLTKIGSVPMLVSTVQQQGSNKSETFIIMHIFAAFPQGSV